MILSYHFISVATSEGIVPYRLSNPTATLYGFDQNGTDHSIVLTLSSPTADSANKVCFDCEPCTLGCVLL